jgi:rare lipoprotein A (peptidoglycan hydrolase)
MRRALVLLLIGTLPFVPSAAAAEGPKVPTLSELRGQRTALVAQIAALTDEAARAQELAAASRRWQQATAQRQDMVRARFAQHAVGAYIDGVAAPEIDQLRRKAWADVLATTDKRILDDLKRGQALAVEAQRRSAAAVSRAARATAGLEEARRKLEQTIADRTAAEAAAAAARQRAQLAATKVRGGTRAVRSTRGQGQLLGRYPFGPVSGIPAGLVATGQVVEGRASWYGPGFDGRQTASGAIFDQEGWTVAHRTLPLGTMLIVSHGGRSVLVLVNDRGPYVGGRVLDLSHGVATALGTVHAGVASVRAIVVAPA